MIKFNIKNFSILSDTITGTTIGGSLGATVGGIMFNKKDNNNQQYYSKETRTVATRKGEVILDKDGRVQYDTVTEKGDKDAKIKFPWFKRGENGKLSRIDLDLPPTHGTLLTTAAGMIIGAALGALVGAGKAIGKKIMQKKDIDWGSLGFGYMETTYSFVANYKNGKWDDGEVCIVLSKVSGEQQILINTASDKTLLDLAEKALKLLPQSNTKVNKTLSDKYNDIIINSIPDKTMPKTIAYIAGVFIKAHYPVYLIEVG